MKMISFEEVKDKARMALQTRRIHPDRLMPSFYSLSSFENIQKHEEGYRLDLATMSANICFGVKDGAGVHKSDHVFSLIMASDLLPEIFGKIIDDDDADYQI
jgi:hypothetical protein